MTPVSMHFLRSRHRYRLESWNRPRGSQTQVLIVRDKNFETSSREGLGHAEKPEKMETQERALHRTVARSNWGFIGEKRAIYIT